MGTPQKRTGMPRILHTHREAILASLLTALVVLGSVAALYLYEGSQTPAPTVLSRENAITIAKAVMGNRWNVTSNDVEINRTILRRPTSEEILAFSYARPLPQPSPVLVWEIDTTTFNSPYAWWPGELCNVTMDAYSGDILASVCLA